MDGRWVCRRCFTSNDAGAEACTGCGLARGAEPGASGPMPAAAAQPERTGAARWLPLLGRFWWVGLVLVVAIGGWWFGVRRDDAGQIVSAGALEVADLRVGDCFNLKDATASEVDQVDAVPCTETHEFELFHDGVVVSAAYPGEADFDAWVFAECLPAFASYVGLAYEASVLDFSYFAPVEDGWAAGDHTVQCALYDPADTALTASLRDARR